MKLVLAIALLAAIVAFVVRDGTRIPDDIQPIAWNAEPRAHCRMLIGDPAFAAQVITTDGTVRSFDDPGCAARFIRDQRDRVHRAWFHAGTGDTWIPPSDLELFLIGAQKGSARNLKPEDRALMLGDPKNVGVEGAHGHVLY